MLNEMIGTFFTSQINKNTLDFGLWAETWGHVSAHKPKSNVFLLICEAKKRFYVNLA